MEPAVKTISKEVNGSRSGVVRSPHKAAAIRFIKVVLPVPLTPIKKVTSGKRFTSKE